MNNKLIEKKKILVSVEGQIHFIDEIIENFKTDYEVIIDEWEKNKNFDSRIKMLNQVNYIFCEWCSNNATWYSNNKKPEQKLIIRLHRWELYSRHFFQINWQNVDKIIFISPYIQNVAIYRYSHYFKLNKENFDKKYYLSNNEEFFINSINSKNIKNEWKHFNDFIKKNCGRVPNFKICGNSSNFIDEEFKNKTIFIPNYIKKNVFINIEKNNDYEYNLGLVGFIPKLKRADIAIEILNYLVKINPKYRLFIIGKQHNDVKWLKKNKVELDYIDNLNNLIKKYKLEQNVFFENYSSNIGSWFKKIGYILGTSDIEGSHHSLAEGMRCGTIPLLYGSALKKYRLDLIYPSQFCFFDNDITNLCKNIIELNNNNELRLKYIDKCINFSSKKFDFNKIYNQIKKLIE